MSIGVYVGFSNILDFNVSSTVTRWLIPLSPWHWCMRRRLIASRTIMGSMWRGDPGRLLRGMQPQSKSLEVNHSSCSQANKSRTSMCRGKICIEYRREHRKISCQASIAFTPRAMFDRPSIPHHPLLHWWMIWLPRLWVMHKVNWRASSLISTHCYHHINTTTSNAVTTIGVQRIRTVLGQQRREECGKQMWVWLVLLMRHEMDTYRDWVFIFILENGIIPIKFRLIILCFLTPSYIMLLLLLIPISPLH